MCGEHHFVELDVPESTGSSPHVRGAHHCGAGNCHCEGIIPACAGSTSRAFIRFSAVRDHPRMCGEHWGSHDLGRAGRGSSPHVRGARANRPLTPWRTGIIPACAGSTLNRPVGTACARDHPRMCGEHPKSTEGLTPVVGSSPHVRGSTAFDREPWQCDGDHPRMCGEHIHGASELIQAQGSSPHVRGARMRRHVMHAPPGIIPACAGSTNSKQINPPQ